MTAASGPPPEALRPAWAALDRRLDPQARAPLAVGFSGGSDSLALLRLACRWAARCGRPVLALTVDHRLHPDSRAWTAAAGEAARGLGADWAALAWTGDKPATGLPSTARSARHALLAEAARRAGAAVLLLGHTADDVDESELIRAGTPAHGRLAEWSPSPAWPQGRGVFLLRPALQVRRAALRAWLAAEGAAWLEDPANADPRFARTRARAALERLSRSDPAFPLPLADGGGAGVRMEPLRSADLAREASGPPAPFHERPASTPIPGPSPIRQREGRPAGIAPFPEEQELTAAHLSLRRAAVLSAGSPAAVLARALLCAGGGTRPPRGAAVARLVERLRAGADVTSTLAGARLQAAGDGLQLTREPGRDVPCTLPLARGEPVVFDGRFELLAEADGWRVAALAGHAGALPRREREGLRRLPAAARPGLPVLLDGEDRPSLPAPFGPGPAQARSLVSGRLAAALGLIGDERALCIPGSDAHPHGGEAPIILS